MGTARGAGGAAAVIAAVGVAATRVAAPAPTDAGTTASAPAGTSASAPAGTSASAPAVSSASATAVSSASAPAVSSASAPALEGRTPTGSARARRACLDAHETAQVRRLAQKLRASLKLLSACSRPECPSVIRNDCATWFGEVKAQLPRLLVTASLAREDVVAATLLVDGRVLKRRLDGAPVELDPGVHQVEVRMAGRPPLRRRVVLSAGERRRRVHFEFPGASSPGELPTSARAPEPLGPPAMAGPLILTVVGATGLLTFAVAAIVGRTEEDALGECQPLCAADDVRRARTAYTVADIGLATGLLALTGAGVWFSLEPAGGGKAPSSAAGRVGGRGRPRGSTGAIFRIGGQF